MGVTADDDELSELLQTMFLEQRSGLKKVLKVDPKTAPANVFKGYLIRMKLYVHLKGLMPRISDVVQFYSTTQFFEKQYGVDRFGNFTSDHKEVADDEEEPQDDSDVAADDRDELATS